MLNTIALIILTFLSFIAFAISTKVLGDHALTYILNVFSVIAICLTAKKAHQEQEKSFSQIRLNN